MINFTGLAELARKYPTETFFVIIVLILILFTIDLIARMFIEKQFKEKK